MNIEIAFDKIRELIDNYPLAGILSIIPLIAALIEIRKFYIEYFSKIQLSISSVAILPRKTNGNIPIDMHYFMVQTKILRKTRKEIYLDIIECRIITDTITTKWHTDEWNPTKTHLNNENEMPKTCYFLESKSYNIYQFEVRIKERGKNKYWKSKSNKYLIQNSQLKEIR